MRSSRNRPRGFTLIELMIVVAIIGLLASIAIPSFIRLQMKSKTAEAKVNVAAIRTAQVAYHTTNGAYVSASASPASNGGTNQVWGYVHPARSGATVSGAFGCAGVYAGASGAQTSVVGPCQSIYGRSEF